MRKLIGKVLTRRDTSANWTKNNPILGNGECGYATDLRRTKHGDGTTRWNSLPWDDAATANGHTVNADVPAGAKFTDTTYSAATQSANGLMSAADKKAIDREFFRMVPKGGTYIPENADLNSIEYIKVGNYYNTFDRESTTIKNIPVIQSPYKAFMMYVLSPLLDVYDIESTDQWVYRLRIFVTYTGNDIFTQQIYSENTPGRFKYGPWVKQTNSNDLDAVSKIINDHIANKANPHGVTKDQVGLGSVANLDQSKAIKSITRSGTTFTATALDGTTTTFTQQDGSTTYSVATSSADGLMSAADKTKLDGIDPSAITTNAANIKKNADAISAETTRAKAAEKANADTISAEVTRAKKAEEANTQLTNDLKTGLTSGTVRVAKATAADSASSLGKVTTYQTWIPDNGGRRKYLLMYDITDWISAKSNAPTRGFDGYFISRRGSGFVGNNCTGTLSMVASYNGMSGSTPIKSDDSQSLRLRTTSEMYKPVILHNTSTNKYYLALETYGSVRDLVLFGIFQGAFVGKWVQNVGQSLTPGTLPDGYELYSEGYVSIPYERAIADKNGKDITEYLVAAAYADGAFTFTRGDGGKTVLTIPAAVSSTTYSVATSSADGLMSAADKSKLDGIGEDSVSQPTFAGTKATISAAYTPAGTVTVTPDVQLNTTPIAPMDSAGTLPSFTTTVTNKKLILGWDAGTLATKGAAVTVATSIKSQTASATFTGTSGTAVADYTPTGTVSKPTFNCNSQIIE